MSHVMRTPAAASLSAPRSASEDSTHHQRKSLAAGEKDGPNEQRDRQQQWPNSDELCWRTQTHAIWLVSTYLWSLLSSLDKVLQYVCNISAIEYQKIYWSTLLYYFDSWLMPAIQCSVYHTYTLLGSFLFRFSFFCPRERSHPRSIAFPVHRPFISKWVLGTCKAAPNTLILSLSHWWRTICDHPSSQCLSESEQDDTPKERL